MCEVWQEVLKRERVGIQDNFFSLGGDSILSIRVVAMLKSRGIVLNIKDIFQYQTVEKLASQASAAPHDESSAGMEQITRLLINEHDEFSEDEIETTI